MPCHVSFACVGPTLYYFDSLPFQMFAWCFETFWQHLKLDFLKISYHTSQYWICMSSWSSCFLKTIYLFVHVVFFIFFLSLLWLHSTRLNCFTQFFRVFSLKFTATFFISTDVYGKISPFFHEKIQSPTQEQNRKYITFMNSTYFKSH